MITFKQFIIERELTSSSIDEIEDKIRKECGLEKFWIQQTPRNPDIINLQLIVVSKDERGNGQGTKAIKMLCDYADQNGFIIALTPSDKSEHTGTTSKARLIKFYERFGFVKNAGSKQHPGISATMYRAPKLSEALTKRVEYNVTRATPELFTTEAKIGGRRVKFIATKLSNDWDIEFSELDDDDKETFAATGSGNAFEVLSFVFTSMREFVDRYKPAAMQFTADSPTRAAIYRKAMRSQFKDFTETHKSASGIALSDDMLRFVSR